MYTEPIFKKRGAFNVIGVERYTANGIPSIQEAWSEFTNRVRDIPNAILPGVYGVEDYSRDFVMNEGGRMVGARSMPVTTSSRQLKMPVPRRLPPCRGICRKPFCFCAAAWVARATSLNTCSK